MIKRIANSCHSVLKTIFSTFALVVLASAYAGASGIHLSTPTYNNVSVLLQDGRFLVVGGQNDTDTTVGSMQIYSSSASAFTNVVDARFKRSSHTATLMADGKVLIAGGIGEGGEYLKTAIIFDPATNAVSDISAMNYAHAGHTATLLKNGRVLIAGGAEAANTPSTYAELYDPASLSFIPVGPMLTPRWEHTATLLRSSMVYITGGINPSFADGGFIPISEIFDPTQGTYGSFIASKAALWRARANHTATLLSNGYVVTTGGKNNKNYFYNPSGICTNAGTNPCQRTTDNSYVEYGTEGYENTTEMYDPYSDISIPVAPMPGRVSLHTAHLNPQGTVSVIGGRGNFDDNHIELPFVISDSTMTLTKNATCTLTDCNNGTVLAADSTVLAKLNADFISITPAVSGQFVNARIIVPPGSTIETGDAVITLSSPLQTWLNGQTVLEGQATNSVLFDTSTLVATVSFPARTIAGFPRAMTSLPNIAFTPSSLAPEATGTLVPASSSMSVVVAFKVDASDYVDLGSYVTKFSAKINNSATLTAATSAEITLTGTYPDVAGQAINSAANAPIYRVWVTDTFWFAGDYGVTIPMTFTGLNGTVVNTSTYATLSSPFTGELEIASLGLTIRYFINRITPTTYNLKPQEVSTMTVRLFNYADNMTFSPATTGAVGAWAIGSPLGLWFDNKTYFHVYPRFAHSSLLLPSGDVILTGGRTCQTSDCSRTTTMNDMEPIEPTVEAWGEDTQVLHFARAQHTATLLTDGRILVAGGTNATQTLNSSEILPSYGAAWVNTSKNMPVSSAGHTASLLPNGNVLTAGGYYKDATKQVILSSASIYYPASDSWSPTTPLPAARQGHTAVFLPFGQSAGNIAMIGGQSVDYLKNVTVYVSTSSTWFELQPMTTARSRHTATTLKDGRILVAGGLNAVNGVLSNCEIYNPVTNTWTTVGSLSHPRHSHTATLLPDGRVFVFGGNDGTGEIMAAEIFSTTASVWMAESGIPSYDATFEDFAVLPRFRHTATLLPNNRVLITGGFSSLNQSLTAGGVYSPLTRRFKQLPTLVLGRGDHTVTLMQNGMIYAIGGKTNAGYTNKTESMYFMSSPDDAASANTSPASERMPILQSDTTTFDHIATISIYTSSHNFFGVTEAGSGGTNNSSQSHPRITMQMIDNPSGYIEDLSTAPFSAYGNTTNTSWATMQSSMTITTPNMPYGWYHLRASNGGVYSSGYSMFVSSPMPQGQPGPITRDSSVDQTTTTLAWVWTKATSAAAPLKYMEAYNIYNSTDGVFISTSTIPAGDETTQIKFLEHDLKPNMAASISVEGFNISGSGPKTKSSTFYTLAAPPTKFYISTVSFVSAMLNWETVNSTFTAYEISMSQNGFATNDVTISTPMPFSPTLDNSAEISNLEPGKTYSFRIRARNNEGVVTSPYLYVSTITIGSASSIQGSANGPTSIFWNWPSVTGATHYYIYDENNVLLSTVTASTNPSFSQIGLSTNTSYGIQVQAANLTVSTPVYGMMVQSGSVSTLADTPVPYVLSPYVTTALTATGYWSPATNPKGTLYILEALKNNSSGVPYVFASAQVTQDEDFMSFLSYPVDSLTPNTKYYMRVYAMNQDSVKTDTIWLSTGIYTLSQPPLVKSVVPSNITASSFQIIWDKNGNPDTTQYQVEIASAQTGPYSAATNLAFANAVTKSTVTISNLLTSTQYYVQVRTRNGDGILSAPTAMLPPSTTTLSGPLGTPAGYISGFTSSGQITGTLPSGRTMTLTIPTGAFENDVASPVEIAFGETTGDPCKTYTTDYPTVLPVFKIFSTNGMQPTKPMTLSFSYFPGTPDELGGRSMNDLAFSLLNENTQECLPLQTTITKTPRQVSTTLNHLSTFQLSMMSAQSTLDNVAIYPNPFYPNRGNGFVTFSRMPVPSNIRIYTLSGEKVWEGSKTNASPLIWEGKNSAGEQVASGIYLVLIDGAGQKKIRKLAVER